MPAVRQEPDPVIAIFSSDWHLRDRPPVARSAEPDWFEAQSRPLVQLNALRQKHKCPLFIAGDLFDRHDASAHLLSFLMWTMRKDHSLPIYAIPGQHDLPNHDYKSLSRSAYWTLYEADWLTDLNPKGTPQPLGCTLITAFPWGFEPRVPVYSHPLALNVAIVHAYVWIKGHCYPGADRSKHYNEWVRKLRAYDVVFFGDNHLSWLVRGERGVKPTVCNCGALQRLTSDQRSYRPRGALLHHSGWVEQHFLDVKGEVWSDLGQEVASLEVTTGLDLTGFIDEMGKLRDQGHDFGVFVRRWAEANKVSKDVVEVVIQCLKTRK